MDASLTREIVTGTGNSVEKTHSGENPVVQTLFILEPVGRSPEREEAGLTKHHDSEDNARFGEGLGGFVLQLSLCTVSQLSSLTVVTIQTRFPQLFYPY